MLTETTARKARHLQTHEPRRHERAQTAKPLAKPRRRERAQTEPQLFCLILRTIVGDHKDHG